MQAQDLLSLLDVIKHEEIYTKRLETLQAAEKQFKESKEIAATIDLANKYLDDAKLVEESRKILLSNAKKEIELLREEQLEIVVEREKKLDIKWKQVETHRTEAFAALKEQQSIQNSNEKRTQELLKWEKSLFEIERNTKDLIHNYNEKFNLIKSIIARP